MVRTNSSHNKCSFYKFVQRASKQRHESCNPSCAYPNLQLGTFENSTDQSYICYKPSVIFFPLLLHNDHIWHASGELFSTPNEYPSNICRLLFCGRTLICIPFLEISYLLGYSLSTDCIINISIKFFNDHNGDGKNF